jgi:hypothetical protein
MVKIRIERIFTPFKTWKAKKLEKIVTFFLFFFIYHNIDKPYWLWLEKLTLGEGGVQSTSQQQEINPAYYEQALNDI